MNKLINGMLLALNEITVSGKENHELLLGCILALEKLKEELEGVYHGGNSEGENISGVDPVSTSHSE